MLATAPRPVPLTALLALTTVLAAGVPAQEEPPPRVDAPAPAADAQQRPRDDERGFVSIFDGETLRGWTPKFTGSELGVNFRDTFRVRDGVLAVCYDDWHDPFGARFGHLFFATPFSHYVLRLEYRFVGEQVEGGPGWAFRNSGVMIHGQPAETMRVEQDFPVSIEVQLLGGREEGERHTANLCTPGTNVVMGDALEQRHCIDSRSKTFRGDEWIAVEVEVHGSDRIVHRVNGEVVLEYRQPQLDPRDRDAKRMIEARGEGAGLLLDGGSISLQAESHPCEFRNLRIKALPVPGAEVRDGAPGDGKRD
ncbi:MAG: DUF1080 domain-containing protein [Planctomycetes bacterium]|nr:DUF1080 domain-containing protein [Planctomycetota bacterium]